MTKDFIADTDDTKMKQGVRWRKEIPGESSIEFGQCNAAKKQIFDNWQSQIINFDSFVIHLMLVNIQRGAFTSISN